MEPIELSPGYSTKFVPGKCLKCLAEQELNACFVDLLMSDHEDEDIRQRYETIVTFLKSDKSKALRDESERLLGEGKHVSIVIDFEGDQPKYTLKIGK